MPQAKDIELLDPFEHHGLTVSTIRLKEPTAGLYADLAEPRIWIRNASGGYWIEQPAIIKQYLNRLIDHPDGAELLKLMSLADAMQVKDVLFGFFAAAEERIVSARLTSFASATDTDVSSA